MSAPQPARSAPQPIVLEGRYTRLEPIGRQHAADIYAASAKEPERYRWLFSHAPHSVAEVERRIGERLGRDHWRCIRERQEAELPGWVVEGRGPAASFVRVR